MLGHLQRQKSHHYFDLLDQDDDGYIDGEDFEIQAKRLAEERDLSDDEHDALRRQMLGWWNQLCATADANDDDQVSRGEWENFWDAIQTAIEEGTEEEKEQMLSSLEQSAKVTFQTIDASGSGEITEEEYADWLAAWNAEGSSTAFEQLDRSGDGTLSEDDLIQATKEFYLSNDFDDPGNLLYGSLQ
jgi:Ca2+-binding EF-hand superfamily protein